MPQPPVIIDCDPGQDDAVAILLALKHLDVLGVTTVSGNVGIDRVTANAQKVLALAGRSDVPVARGAGRPLLREVQDAATVHGESGLDGYDFPAPATALDSRHGVQFIIETVRAREGVTLVPLGPLTNVALALRTEPGIATRLAGISLMGGSTDAGNMTPAAEFNIWADAEAAAIVFASGVPITMCGLNLTRQATIGDAEIARIRALPGEPAKAVAALLSFYRGSTSSRTGRGVAYLHDPCAVAALIRPDLFTFEDLHVAVETKGELTYGMTLCDRRAYVSGVDAPNARVATKLDHASFVDLLCETLGMYG
jgi:inosine-uridine nucleoside N-ribohydrolase